MRRKRKRQQPKIGLSPIPSVATCHDAKSRLSDETIDETYRSAKTTEHLTQGETEGLAIVRHKRTTKANRQILGLIDNKPTSKRNASNGKKHRNARTSSDTVKAKREKRERLISDALSELTE